MSAAAPALGPLPWLDGPALRAALPILAAVDALEEAFAGGRSFAPPRGHHDVPGGVLLVMPAAGPTGTGVKLVTIAPDNPARGLPLISGVYVLFEPDGLRPAGLVEGAALTALRTAAVSAVAARHLARPDSAHLVVFGAGTQARSHVDAFRALFPLERLTVVSRGRERATALVEQAERWGLDARLGEPSDIAAADLVATCTTSPQPVLDGALLAEGTHVTAVGAYTAAMRELDGQAIRRARLVVEDRAVALAEAGEVCLAIDEGLIGPDHVVADLPELVRGAVVRRSDADITVFKSVGMAVEDLAVVTAAVERWRSGQVGG